MGVYFHLLPYSATWRTVRGYADEDHRGCLPVSALGLSAAAPKRAGGGLRVGEGHAGGGLRCA